MNIVKAVVGLIDKVIPDKDARESAKERLIELDKKGLLQGVMNDFHLAMGQIEINKIEAAHKSLFVAGWRPFIGWVCGVGLLYQILIAPFLGIFIEVPPLDSGLLTGTLGGLLGLGTLRTVEKIKQVSREK